MTNLKPSARLLIAAIGLSAALPLAAEARGRRGAGPQAERPRAPERVERRVDRREDAGDHGDRGHDRRRERRHDRRDDRRFRDWDDWVDFRLQVAGARLLAGMIFDSLPPDAAVIVIDGTTYRVQGGVYLVKVVQSGGVHYRVVNPPAAAVVGVLGPGARVVRVRGLPYHLLDGVYHVQEGATFVRVPAP